MSCRFLPFPSQDTPDAAPAVGRPPHGADPRRGSGARIPPRPFVASVVLLGCFGILTMHFVVLYTSGADPLATPISALSRGVDGGLHSLGLLLFACSPLALAALLHRRGGRWHTRLAQALLVLDAGLILYVARYFATASETTLSGPGAHDPLMLLASGIGLVMGLIMPGLMRRHRGAGLWNIVCFALWLALLPLLVFVEPSWIGAYQRTVGTVLIAWMAGLAVLLGFTEAPDGPFS